MSDTDEQKQHLSSLAVPAPNEPDGAVPPGEEWMTHGGYLGCLIAITFGCLLAAFVASPLVRGLAFAKQGTAVGFVVGASVLMVLGIVVFGRLGWWIGKRVYREYPLAHQSQSLAPLHEEPLGEQ